MAKAKKPFRSVVLGCGMGGGHARVMHRLEEYELVAVCDLNEARAKELVAKLEADVKIYTDYATMLAEEKPDVVAVATPTDSHAKLTIQAAEAGVRGICCEKPMAVSYGDARAMVKACKDRGVSLIVNHQRRMSAPMVRMRELIVEGAIGDVYLIRASNSGDLLSDGTHAVDSVRWLAGDQDIKWVLGQAYRNTPPPGEEKGMGYYTKGGWRYGHMVESGAFGLMEFASGLRAEILTGEMRMPGRQYQDYEVIGTKGRLWRPGDQGEPPASIRDEAAGGWRAIDLPQGERRWEMVESYRQFARMMRAGGDHPLSGDSSLKDQEVIMAIHESARTHRRIDLPLKQDAYPLPMLVDEIGE
jgi:UDP-N-acetyl-2-amino-2-deoxyglucuronate dehydrogenase